MKKHDQLLKHRDIQKLGISDTGGLIVKFQDESHTYIPFNDLLEILDKINELIDQGKIIIKEE